MKENQSSKYVSIIVPAYNVEKGFQQLLNNLTNLYMESEIIVIDDGSEDNLFEIFNFKGIKYFRHEKNRGYGASLKTGIKNSSCDILIFIDGDGQHDPKDIGRLIAEINDSDMVVGARGKGSYNPWRRKLGKWLIKKVANYLAKNKIPDLNSGLRAVRRNVIMKYLHLMPNGFSFSTTITITLLKQGYKIKYIPIKTKKREGKSSVKAIKDGIETIMLILRLITLFDPMRVYLPVSFICIFGAFIYQIMNIISYGFHIVGGTIIAFLIGVLIFLFGLLADQVSSLRLEKYE